MSTILSRTGILAVAATGAMLVACNSNRSNTASTDTTSAAAATGATPGAPVDTTAAGGSLSANGGWTDGQILAYAAAASKGEIAEAKLAEQKATSPAVKSFARQMVTDHTKMLNEGEQFAKQNNITPDTTKDAVTDLMKTANDQLSDLRNKAKGNDWDSDYMGKQVDAHQDVLDHLQDAEKATSNQALKDMLNKAVGTVQSHLTKAKDIKDNQLKS